MRALFLSLLLSLALAACGYSEAAAQVGKLYPVDEAADEPSFFSFRARLLMAAEARDTAFLYSVLAPDILNSFGGDGGIDEFRIMWRPADPDSRVWSVLTEVLSLGGTMDGDSAFAAPYTSSAFPGELDAFDHLAVVGADVRVRRRPRPAAPVLTTLSFDLVQRAPDSGGRQDGWVAVRLADGRTGWIAGEYVRGPTDYRATFVRQDGRWRMRFLVAGD